MLQSSHCKVRIPAIFSRPAAAAAVAGEPVCVRACAYMRVRLCRFPFRVFPPLPWAKDVRNKLFTLCDQNIRERKKEREGKGEREEGRGGGDNDVC